MEGTKLFSCQDVNLAAYLLFSGIIPHLEKNSAGRVVFFFETGPDFYVALNNYNADVQIPVASYVSCLKSLRGKLL